MAIQILTEAVASQIAAGEVVERPASVVKELLENALDAGASHISISISDAGKRSIEISDNGSGILRDELPVAVMRHATSKLRSAEDLFRIGTLGFRGEALASIGSVSNMVITSRTVGQKLGGRIRVEAGIPSFVETVGAPQGTQILVEDLFYSVPARMKFLKTDTTEKRHIDLLVMRYALAYPEVRIHLIQDGKFVLQTSGNGDRREVLSALYGVELAKAMLAVDTEDASFHLDGYISPPAQTRSNRREIHFYVNGRPVHDSALFSALHQAYHNFLMVGRYPIAHLFLTIPPDQVDVNVHPTKAEVRFRNPEVIFSRVQSAIRRGLLAYSPVPELNVASGWGAGAWDFRSGSQAERLSLDIGTGTKPAYVETNENPIPERVQSVLPGRMPLLRLIGQVASTFLVAEGPDGLYLIDQHAAHERVLFEKMLSQQKESALEGTHLPAQGLLEPVIVNVPPQNARILNEQLPLLNTLGFEVELFGSGTYLVRALPALLAHMTPADALSVLVEDFEEDETPLQTAMEARVIARVCKRAAIKAGQIMTIEEQAALISELENCASPRTCPHGRPTMIHLSVDLLERQFGRKGAR